MPAPKTRAEFYDVVRRSGLVDPVRLEELAQHSNGAAEDVPQAAQELVARGVVTAFHARQLLKGRYRGFSLGKYLVLEQLGEGGMGKVFLCVHMIMRRLVAIKILSRDLASDPGTVERFQREARAVAALDHPNIVRAHDMDQEGDVHFIVMEYVDGISLHDLVRKRGPLDVASACHYVKQAAIGIQQVMDNRMIHRDIKPGNLLLDRRGVVKILDLGLARFSHEKHGSLTQKFDEGSVLGTADYLAPEQAIDSHQVDIRADIYSLGATFYFLLSGKPPFEGGSVTQKLLYHQMQSPTSLRKLRPDLPGDLVDIVDRMMAKDPAERPQTPSEVMYALEPWTRNPLPLPRDQELPRHCPYVQKAAQGDLSTSLSALQAATTVHASGVRLAQAAGVGATAYGGYGGGVPMSESYGGVNREDSAVTASGASPSSQANVRLSDASFPGRDANTARMGAPATPSDFGASPNGMMVAPSTRRRKSKAKRKVFMILGAGSVLALVVALVLFFSPFRGDGGDQELIVSQTAPPGPNTFKTLQEAWDNRNPSAKTVKIWIEDKEIREQLKLTQKPDEKAAVYIQGRLEGGTPGPGTQRPKVRWLPPANVNPKKPLLQLENVHSIAMFSIDFDGADTHDDLLVAKGKCDTLILTGLDFRNMRQCGIRFISCQPTRSNLTSLNFAAGKDTDAFMVFESEGGLPNKNLFLRQCTMNGSNRDRKEGKLPDGYVIKGPLENVRLIACPIYNVGTGIFFPGEAPATVGLTVEESVFSGLGAGFRFEVLPKPAQGMNIVVGDNTFNNVKRIAMVGKNTDDALLAEPAPGALPNLHWIWTTEGNPLQNATPGTRYFRTTFNLPPGSGTLLLDIVCDDTCKAWLNNTELEATNPTDGAKTKEFPLSPRQRRVFTVDVTRIVKPDVANVLAIEASDPNKKGGPRGVLVRLWNQQSGTIPLVSDGKWKWSSIKPPIEWLTNAFSTDTWQSVKPLVKYTDGPTRPRHWINLQWDSEVAALFNRAGGRPWQIIQLMPNRPSKRDASSAEAFPNLETNQENPRQPGR
jgi:eukaryotic-like serine/threonine-protein kinase